MKNLLKSMAISMIISGMIFGMSQMAFAQSDEIIDLDGIVTKGIGVSADQEVFPGATLVAWPAPPGATFPPMNEREGIDWVDRDKNPEKAWSDGDSLFSEDDATCTTSDRDMEYDEGIDCVILEGPLGPIPDGLLTDCDLETGTSPSMLFPPGTICQDIRPNVLLTFFDTNENGFWNDGEDIVLDFNGNLIFDPPMVVGGKFLDVDKTALVLAGTQFTSSWVIPTLVAAIGFGLVISRKI